MGRARRSVVLGTAAAVLLLLLAAPTPAEALRELGGAADTADATAPLVGLLALAAWALAGWLALTVAVTVGGHLPGALGRGCARAARRVAPAAVRRGVEVALGLTVVVGVVGATPAAATPGSRPAAPPAASLDGAAPAPGLDWGSAPDAAPAQDLDWAATPAEDTSPPAAEPAADAVVVQPGDTLWGLAEQDLAARAGTAPADAEIAQAWPSWWAANRDAIGEDPHLIQPGTSLTPPADDTPPSASS